MKKFYLYSLLTSLLLLCSNVASAHDFEVNGVYYTIASSSAKTVAVTYSGSSNTAVADEYSGIVTIPSTVTYNNVTYIVEGIGKYAFCGCTGVILVNISEGVKIIGESAFSGCSALASVTIPNSVTSIGQDAFYECSSLAKLNIPGSVTSIGHRAFGNCINLKKVYITDLSAWCKIDFGEIGNVRSLTQFDLYLNGEKVTNLVIPSDITEIKKNTFQYCSGLTSVTIGNSVTTIGDYAFRDCSGLTSITIPNSVTTIGSRAFSGCSGLTSIEIPNSVTTIGSRAFSGCSGLTSVTIPNSVTSIGELAFDNCTGLTAVNITDLSAWCKINFVTTNANPLYYAKNLYLNGEKVTNLVIPRDITEIKKSAFIGCSGLADITFHDNVMLINQYAFYNCSGLRNVTIGSGVMVLGADAFNRCSNLRCVTIPNSVISIGGNAFYGCSNLYTVIDYSDLGITKGSTDNGYVGYYATNIYTSGDDIPQDYIFETIDGVNTLVAYFGKSNDVVLPSNYNGGNYAIGDSVFYNSSITSIKIPNSVTSIGNSAFYDCSGLTGIEIPNSVTSIGSSAFYGCTGLTSVTIPNSVSSIGYYAFLGCTGLTSITIPNSVTSIGYSAFYGCTGLTSITIPNSVTTIGINAFYNCPLEKVEINTTTIDTWFSRLTSIKEIIIGDSVTSIGSSAFYGCTGLTSVTIPNSVTSIGESAFRGCTGLTSITIPNSVTTIGINAFYNCPLEKVEINTTTIDTWFRGHTSIKEIIIGNSVTSIGSSAFRDCSGLESVTVDSGNTVYDSREGCNAIIETATNTLIQGCKNTIIPNSVTSIGYSAFYGCTGLTSITIPNSVSSIGAYAFSGCTGLEKVEINTTTIDTWFRGHTSIKEIIIGDSVTSIGESAFYDCSGLTGIEIPNSVTTMGDYAFCNCEGLTSVTIPNSVSSIGYYAFYGCTGLTIITIPNSVTSIGDYAFNGCNGISEIYAMSATPATAYSYTFDGVPTTATLYVPTGAKAAYQAANYWKNFTNIVEVKLFTDLRPCGENLTCYINNRTKTLHITGTGDMTDYVYSELLPWYNYRDLITSVVIDDRVTSIGNSAFKYCSGLTSVTIPNSVTSIGNYAFQYCDLREIHIPAGVTTIGDYAFSHNNNLEKITAAKENTRYSTPEGYNVLIDNNTIYGSTLVLGGKGAIIPDGIVSIGDGAFNGIHGITSITIPASVEAIGGYAFEACSDLKEIHCLANDRYISVGNFAFDGLYETTTLYIPAAGKKYYTGSWADFANIVVVGEIVVDGLSYAVISEEEKTVQVIDYSGSNEVVNIPSSITYNGEIYKVTAICYQAFKDYTNISGITIPASVSSIGYDAFVGCTNLASIKVESGNPVFDSRENCNAIITTAINELIQGCKNTIIPNSVTSIRDWAFYGCTGLTSVTIPNSVTSIGNWAFSGCSGLTSVTIPNSVTSIGELAFSGCSGLTSITIPNSVTRIGYDAFYYCTNLATVVNNSSLDIIAGSEDHGFVAYYADEVINNRGGSVIGDFVFNDSGNLIKYIGNESEITLPEKSPAGIKYGIVEAFQNNTKITSVIIPDSVSFIYNTFSGCTSLTSVTIGNGVHRIGEAAFQGCSALKDIYVNGIVPALLYSESFAEHYASATLHVPEGTKAAYQSSTSQREEMEIKMLPVYNNDLLASMSGCDKDARYETVKVEAQNPDVAGTLNGNDYLLAYQPSKTKTTDLPKATFETNIVHGGRYKIALVTAPWFIESYSDTLTKISDPQYADSYLRVRVSQNNELLAMIPSDSFNIGTSKTNFGVWEKHAIVPDRSRIDTIFLKDANNEDYIFDFVNNHSVDVNIELLRPLQYNEVTGRYTAKNAFYFAFRFLLDQIMLIPVDESTIVSTIYWKNFNNIVEEANDLTGDVDGDGTVDVADATTLVSMILDNSLATDAADVDGDETVDVADVTSLVNIILFGNNESDDTAEETIGIPQDLGLSVKWASYNVGAIAAWESGDYYAWGETEEKEEYSQNTYKFNGNSSFGQFTKYYYDNMLGLGGDGKTKLDSEDDVARVKWGGSWRMPTNGELDELRDNCTWEWETLYGVKGYRVTGPNGNSIFLPAVGFRTGTEINSQQKIYYWSSTVYVIGGYTDAYIIDETYAGDDYFFDAVCGRYCGLPVRPVCE